MKSIRISFEFALILCMAFFLQGYSCIGDLTQGPKEKETRNVSGFEAIEVSHGIDVFLTMGSSEHIEVEAAEDLLEHLITEVKGNTLKIYFYRPFNWNNDATVWVQAKEINRINTSGGAELRSENILETTELELIASGGSDIRLEVHATYIDVNVSGGADVDLSGSTEKILAKTSGGSDLNAFDLVSKKAELEASGGSDLKIYVEEEIDANTSGGADILYKGNPEVVNIKSSSGGDVLHLN